MIVSRFILAAGLLAAASPALAQGYYRGAEPRQGYVENIITDERHREPVYDVQSAPRYYEPRRTYRTYYPQERTYVVPRDREHMYYNPYLRRRIAPEQARLQVPREPAQQRRSLPAEFQRQTVEYTGSEAPGTIVIDTQTRHLYLVQEGGKAIRYGVGVGRDGFQWTGTHKVTEKKEWPEWRPPKEMLARRPDLPEHMDGGPNNPLGARALYLGSTLYRIHGSNEPWTIGQAVSSGCFRMTNEDVEDLYARVGVGTTVKVL
jgi:lipoprotein-anchoring transpeptidase ErfK/SrfK